MITLNIIEEVKKRLVATYNPLAIYLFGSYVWGKPSEDSDLDILIVIDDYQKDPYHTVVDGHKALSDLHFAKDLFVLSKDQFDEFSCDERRFYFEIKEHGKKIYGRA